MGDNGRRPTADGQERNGLTVRVQLAAGLSFRPSVVEEPIGWILRMRLTQRRNGHL
jgi:hypothetical protein